MAHEADITIGQLRIEQIEAAYQLRQSVMLEELVAAGAPQERARAHIASWGPDEEAIASLTELWGQRIETPSRFCMQAVHQGPELVGLFMGSLSAVGELGAAKYVDAIQLAPSIRGKGIGGQLMARFVIYGSDDDIALHAYAGNERALKFYNRLGFNDLGQDNVCAIDGDYPLMQRLLLKRTGRNHEV